MTDKQIMQKVLSPMRRAIQDFDMIQDGDNIFVGLSGGKDSILLLTALANYKIFSPETFTLQAITINPGKFLDEKELENMKNYCESLSVPLHIVDTDIGEIIFDVRQETNPCSLCAKMRRGALNDKINSLGGGKLALAHNADDVAETFIMSLVYEGRINCFEPKAHMSRANVTMIRPFIYLLEKDIVYAVNKLELPIVTNHCPANKHSQREWAKDFIKTLDKEVPNAKQNILGAIYNPDRAKLWDKKDK